MFDNRKKKLRQPNHASDDRYRAAYALEVECQAQRDQRFNAAAAAMASNMPAVASECKGFLDVIALVLDDSAEHQQNTEKMFAPLELDDAAYRRGRAMAQVWYIEAEERYGLL